MPEVIASVLQIAAFLATFLPLWESREVLIRITVQAITCNKASPESMAKFGSFMGKPGVPRVRVRLHLTPCALSQGQPTHSLRTSATPHLCLIPVVLGC